MKKILLICVALIMCMCCASCGNKEIKELEIIDDTDGSTSKYYYSQYRYGEIEDSNGFIVSCYIDIVPLEEEKFDKPIPREKKDWKLMYITYFLENGNENDVPAKINLNLRIGDEIIDIPDQTIQELGYKYADIETSLPAKFTIEADGFQDVNEFFLIDYDKYKGRQGVAELTVNNKIYVYNFNMDDNVAELRY